MKVSISYPPLNSKKGTPLLSQNRQFQWFSKPTYIYPVVPASAATLLSENGYEVFWDDGIAEELTHKEWKERIIREKPDIIVLETKTPVIKKHWEIIDDIKREILKIGNCKLKIALLGDHVSALPEESLKNSGVDYVIAGGDYDFALLNLANHLEKGEPLKGGIYYRNGNGEIINSGPADISKNNLDELPLINRKLTKWKLYAYENGNFKNTPGAYVMNGRDCWWGKCSFCSWTTLFPSKCYRVRSVEKALDEIGELIDLGVKEIMEDSGTLPVGKWLEDFCHGLISRRYSQKIKIDGNMRFGAIKNPETWKMMKQAGFRMILFGLESANQETLDKINKGIKISDVEPELRLCKSSGLEPHLAVMIGYPWETREDAEKTLSLAKKLFKKNLASTLQATIVVPYPGTLLYQYCQENNLLGTVDYNRFDQKEQVIKTKISDKEIKKMIRKLYWSFLTPQFIFQKMLELKNWNNAKFIFRSVFRVLGHFKDFSRRSN